MEDPDSQQIPLLEQYRGSEATRSELASGVEADDSQCQDTTIKSQALSLQPRPSAVDSCGSEPENKFKKYAKIILPHVGLFLISVIYIVLGALMFYKLERPHEVSLRETSLANLTAERERLLEVLWDAPTETAAEVSQWKSAARDEIDSMTKDLFNAFENNFITAEVVNRNSTNTQDDSWTVIAAIFFTTTLLTTIGYGNIAPKTLLGRVFCICYGLVGVPLILITVADIGKFLSEHIIWLYARYVKMNCSKGSWLPWRRGRRWLRKHRRKRRMRKTNCDGNGTDAAAPIAGIPSLGPTANHKPTEMNSLLDNNVTDTHNNNSNGRNNTRKSDSDDLMCNNIIDATNNNYKNNNINKNHNDDNNNVNSDSEDSVEEEENKMDFPPGAPEGATFEELAMLGYVSIPVSLVLTILIGYTALGAALMSAVEGWAFFKAFYFSFITMTTVGFGDVVPEREEYLLLDLVYIVIGLAITTMCIDLVGIQYIRKIHYFGRAIQDARYALVNVGGRMVQVGDLTRYAALLYKRYGYKGLPGDPNPPVKSPFPDAFVPGDFDAMRYIDFIPGSHESLYSYQLLLHSGYTTTPNPTMSTAVELTSSLGQTPSGYVVASASSSNPSRVIGGARNNPWQPLLAPDTANVTPSVPGVVYRPNDLP